MAASSLETPQLSPGCDEDTGRSDATNSTLLDRQPSTTPSSIGRAPGRSRSTGRRVGRFALLRRLGAGAMGEVFSAYDERLDRRVAIKLVRPQLTGTSWQERMLREAQGLARLSHPNVVQVYEVGEHGDSVFVAMEYVEGCTLREWIDRQRASDRGLDYRAIVEVFIQAGRGLAAAHAAGLVHRDFKPT
ncbi:MAG: protein kinase, partial [Myxococcales bacterium]|nr:protein kinase [Myxococcales bacterium]